MLSFYAHRLVSLDMVLQKSFCLMIYVFRIAYFVRKDTARSTML